MTKKKFECLNCHHRFEADDSNMVVCPLCQSDNVEYAHFRIPKGVWKWGLLALLVIGIGVALYFLNQGGQKTNDSLPENEQDIIVVDSDISVVIPIDVPETITELPTLQCGKLKYEDGGYSFNVIVKHEPKAAYYIAVLEHNADKEIARTDGKEFTGVPPSNDEEGLYDLAIFEASSGRKLNSTTMPGFTRPVAQRMTKQQLQQLIDNDDESLYGVHKQISTDCRLQFSGLPADAKRPETLADVLMKLSKNWKSATVTSVEYDAENRISSIAFAVQVKN